jgi:polysaccharide pyruvyl transferase WcaK-like protein
MLSSRFHAIVTSMPAGVPSMGVTMDERIANLMSDRGHSDLVMRVDDEHLGTRVLDGLRLLDRDAERIRQDVLRFVPHQIRGMGEMAIHFVDEVARVYPDFPRRSVPRTYDHYLPPLGRDLQDLLEATA